MMSQEIEKLERKFDEKHSAMNTKLDKILFYLHNDDATGEKGLIAEFRDHKKQMQTFVTEQKTKEAVRTAKAGVFGTIFGVVGSFLVWVGKELYEIYKH